ncbi:hypothetical protein BDV10DRAFT_77512 [Aspergillus recurvatus]
MYPMCPFLGSIYSIRLGSTWWLSTGPSSSFHTTIFMPRLVGVFIVWYISYIAVLCLCSLSGLSPYKYWVWSASTSIYTIFISYPYPAPILIPSISIPSCHLLRFSGPVAHRVDNISWEFPSLQHGSQLYIGT